MLIAQRTIFTSKGKQTFLFVSLRQISRFARDVKQGDIVVSLITYQNRKERFLRSKPLVETIMVAMYTRTKKGSAAALPFSI